MILGSTKLLDPVECVDATSIRVHAPTAILFVCGGPCEVTSGPPKSLRDAFMRLIGRPSLRPYNVLIAEDLNPFFPKGDYKNILKLETDIVQISELILLFSESFGSAAELGAFAMEPEIAQRLLVFIDDDNYGRNSFITLGPVRELEETYGDAAVCVLNRRDIQIVSINEVSGINTEVFHERVVAPILLRSGGVREHTRLNPHRAGHIIKPIVSLIQHYGTLTLDEIEACLYVWNLTQNRGRIKDFLLCAEFAKWVEPHKHGTHTYHASTNLSKSAMEYKLVAGVQKIDRVRWKADILAHWRDNDPERFLSIQAAIQ